MEESGHPLSEKARSVLPRHVAIIMDGNGRWAQKRQLPRVQGHRSGIESVRDVFRTAAELGIRYLSLYAFSEENWKRPRYEVDTLMQYLAEYLESECRELDENNICLKAIGQIHRLPDPVRKQLSLTCDVLKDNTDMTLVLALSYGSRTEIVDACRSIAERVRSGELEPRSIDEETLSRHLYTRGIPDPELLIRTSGEMRISNYLLWQIAYTEFIVSPTLWPDFRRTEFLAALEEYSRRHRRFGGL